MTMTPTIRKAKAPASAPKRRRAHALTEAEAAAADFEPWQGEVDTKTLPNNEQFSEHGLSHLITCRMALVMMYRTKAELNEMFEQEGNAMCDLIEDMGSAKHFFSHFSKLLDAASARFIVAGSSVCQNMPEKCGDSWPGMGERLMLHIRLRIHTLKLRALCWVLRRLRAGQRDA